MFARKLKSMGYGRVDEAGAITMIVALVAGMGVLLGAAALSIDVGSLYAQRRQVQNGADAAAFSLAQSCIKTPSACNTSTATALSKLAGFNGRTTLNDAANTPYDKGICVENLPASTATDLPSCAAPSGTFVDCPALPTAMAGVAYVEAHTQTLVNGSHILPSTVSKALGFDGANVQACARVAFGPGGPGPANTMPITMSYCDWKSTVGYVDAANPGAFQAPPTGASPGYGAWNPWPATEVTVGLAKNDQPDCPTWNGHTAPGGFAWLSHTGCTANIDVGWVPGDTGTNTECDLTSLYLGKVVYLPIFDCVAVVPVDPITSTTDCTNAAHGIGATNYHIVGYAAFYLSGWDFSGVSTVSVRPPPYNQPNCPGTGNSGRCLFGWFIQKLVSDLPPAESASDTPAFGPNVVRAAG